MLRTRIGEKWLRRIFFVVVFAAIGSIQLYSQSSVFDEEIKHFRQQDSLSFPQPGAIVFVGSSSFRMWKDIQSWFPGYPIINRGFGGSKLPDVIHFANDIIFPYHPKQVVIYCGDNDLASSDTVTAELVVARVKTLFAMIRQNLPAAKISYVSIKPSPSRMRLLGKIMKANKEVEHFMDEQTNADFINVYKKMMREGRPKPELFLADSLHMQPAGYVIWAKKIKPHLLR